MQHFTQIAAPSRNSRLLNAPQSKLTNHLHLLGDPAAMDVAAPEWTWLVVVGVLSAIAFGWGTGGSQ